MLALCGFQEYNGMLDLRENVPTYLFGAQYLLVHFLSILLPTIAGKRILIIEFVVRSPLGDN